MTGVLSGFWYNAAPVGQDNDNPYAFNSMWQQRPMWQQRRERRGFGFDGDSVERYSNQDKGAPESTRGNRRCFSIDSSRVLPQSRPATRQVPTRISGHVY